MTFDAAPITDAAPEMNHAETPKAVAPLPAPAPIQETAATSEQAAMAAAPAPIAPKPALPMPDAKRTEFLYHVASTIRSYAGMGKSEAEAITDLRQSQEALTKALNPHGDVAKAAAQAMGQAYNSQLTHATCHLPESEFQKSMHGIFTKRQAEAQHSFTLLSDKVFVEQAGELAVSGKPLTPPHWFTDAKKEETIAELASDAPAHTLGAGNGSHMLHKALAEVWKIDGPLQAPLAKAIKEAAPELHPEAVIGLTKNWLHDRFHRADVIATETKPGSGSLYIEAMKRTEAKIHPPKPTAAVKEEAPAAAPEVAPAETLTQAAPAAEAHAPVQHEGVVVAQHPELTPAI